MSEEIQSPDFSKPPQIGQLKTWSIYPRRDHVLDLTSTYGSKAKFEALVQAHRGYEKWLLPSVLLGAAPIIIAMILSTLEDPLHLMALPLWQSYVILAMGLTLFFAVPIVIAYETRRLDQFLGTACGWKRSRCNALTSFRMFSGFIVFGIIGFVYTQNVISTEMSRYGITHGRYRERGFLDRFLKMKFGD